MRGDIWEQRASIESAKAMSMAVMVGARSVEWILGEGNVHGGDDRCPFRRMDSYYKDDEQDRGD